jgi:hypothetical protein
MKEERMMQHRISAACAAMVLAFFIPTQVIAAEATSTMQSMSGAMMAGRTVLCPTGVSVVLKPTAPAAGWSTNNSPVALSLDAKNHPRVESGELICYYAMPDGYNAFVYFQALGGRTCTVRGDNTGFTCH